MATANALSLSQPAAPGLRSSLRVAHGQEPRDRWLLMRLLVAGQSTPKLADRLTAAHAKAHTSEIGRFIARTATEVHGGMGITDLLGLDAHSPGVGLLEPPEAVATVLRTLFADMIGRRGMSVEAAKRSLLSTEPFQNYPGLIAGLGDPDTA